MRATATNPICAGSATGSFDFQANGGTGTGYTFWVHIIIQIN